MNSIFSANHLKISSLPCDIYHFSALDSTNQKLKDWMPSGDTAIYADFQTKGRGQGDHRWQCDKGMGLLMSLLYYPKKECSADELLRQTAAVVCLCLEHYSVKAAIKAPNDIFVENKKLGGILLENIFHGDRLTASIIGIGINLAQEGFDAGENFAHPPVSLKQLGVVLSAETLFYRVLENFYQSLSFSSAQIMGIYEKRLL